MNEQMIGTILGGEYELTGWLCSGRYGAIYQGQDSTAWEVTASLLDYLASPTIKRLDDQFTGMMEKYGTLAHPGLQLPYDAGVHEGTPYLIRSYSDAHPIAGELRLAPLAMERVIHIGRELCDLLALLHTVSPLHGALNRQTVLLQPTRDFPQVQLTGFGPSPERLPPAGPDTAPDELIYLAPEQWASAPLNAQTDLYGVGVLLYELATGQPPYPVALLQQTHAWQQPPPALSDLNERVPESLETLVNALLAAAPADRPVSAAYVRDQLAQIGQSDLLPPRQPPTPKI